MDQNRVFLGASKSMVTLAFALSAGLAGACAPANRLTPTPSEIVKITDADLGVAPACDKTVSAKILELWRTFGKTKREITHDPVTEESRFKWSDTEGDKAEYESIRSLEKESLANLRLLVQSCKGPQTLGVALDFWQDAYFGHTYNVDEFYRDMGIEPMWTRYTVVGEWNAKVLDVKEIDEAGLSRFSIPIFKSQGTNFFLGEYEGKMVFATNHHVIRSQKACGEATMKSGMMGLEFKCERVLISDVTHDFAIITATLAEEKKGDDKVPGDKSAEPTTVDTTLRDTLISGLKNSRLRFDFKSTSIPVDVPLVSVSHGGFRSRSANHKIGRFHWAKFLPAIDTSAACRIVSADVRLMHDTDRLNYGGGKRWSMAHGCAVSHGSSGSPLMNRETGRVVGVVWTIGAPKANPRKGDFPKTDDEKFAEYALAVPSLKIAELIQTTIASSGTLDETDRSILEGVLKDGRE